ncbi:hypothetical protein A3D73_02680 [Candidatus Uhrbacteria bacterium RIFCSPHIGHO2_02_FULL_60_44]|nr:MAG: hypothetical protein A3D73_02680 [Candidatus Uhrbacteria bacterium RIFCSPHIGHO2_02_FULL_60_44]
MNVDDTLTAKLCSGTVTQFVQSQPYDCAALNASKSYSTQGKLNEFKIVDLDFDDIAGRRIPVGFYALTAVLPSLQERNQENWQSREAVVVDTALTLKRDKANKLLVWATDLETGDVVPNLDVTAYRSVYNGNGEVIGTGKTGADGTVLIQLSGTNPNQFSATVIASDGKRLGVAATYWDDGIDVWNFGLESSYSGLRKHIGYLYTDRRIYRPDQMVYFKGVVRQDVDAALALPAVRQVKVTITDPVGTQLFTHDFPLSSYGTFNGYFQLKPEMNLGSYTIATEITAEGHDASNITGSFDVREYRRPDFKVEIQPPEGTQIAGRPLKATVNASYYYGSPLVNASVYYEITRNKLYFQPMRDEWYSYTMADAYDCWWWCRPEGDFETVKTGEGTIGDDGTFTVELPKDLTDYKSSAVYNVSVTVTDVSQRQVSANASIEVHRGEFYVGIRPNYSEGWGTPNANFDLATVTPDGTARPDVNVTVKLYKRTWSSVYKEQVDGSSAWESEKKDELLDTKTVQTDALGKGDVRFSPPGSGEFVAIAEARDSLGNLVQASTNRYIWRGEPGTVRITDDHHMKIVQTKGSYEVGDTASLAVQTPYENAKALVTVERNTIRSWKVMNLGSANRIVEIPIKDDATPNEYVSVLTVKGSKSSVPEFRLGYANLQVNTTKKVLDLKISTDKQAYRPRDKVTLTLETKRSDGSPVAAEVSVAVVDERVVSLLGSIDKNILGRFWFPRTIGVQTAQTLTMLVKKVFFATVGGDGKGGEANVPSIRGNFQDTAYWKADVVTGSDGKATVSFDLPDNLTSWQILAIGASKDTVVGSAEAKIVTRRDLMVEPILPRILRYQDTAQVGATVHNNTDAGMKVALSLDAKGVTLDGSASKSITLGPKSRQLVSWTVRVPLDSPEASFTVTAKANGFEDGFVQKIPVLPYSVSETVSASGIFEKNVTETLEIPEGILKNQGDVQVAVQPNVGNGLREAIKYLDSFPYECAEQRTSRMFANLMAEELGKLQVSDMTDAQIQEGKDRVNAAIAAIISRQKPNGGWGFWPEYEDSRAWLTSYVYYGLHQAERAGFAVDQNVMSKADAFMRGVLAGKIATDDWWWRQYWLNERAMILFAMSERDPKGLKGYMDTLYEKRSELATFGKIYLAMAYANVEKGTTSARSTTLLGDIKNKIVYLNPSTIYLHEDWDWGELLSSDLRTSSLYLQALLRIDPKNSDIERVVRYIMQNRKDGYWYSTHATAVTLLGLVEYVRANPIDKTAQDVRVFLNNDLAATLNFKDGDVTGEQSQRFAIGQLLKSGDTHQVGIEKDSDKRWFYDVNMKVYRQAMDIEPFENGFTVLSDYYDLKDKTYSNPLRIIRQGDNVKVRIKLLVPKRRRYVALEHHLPAGLEAVDFQLKTSAQYLQNQEKQCAPTWWGEQECFSNLSWNWGWWWENVWKHIELRDDRVFLFSENLEPGVYEYTFIATAVTPGEFRVPPARAYEFYNPLANAHNEGKIIKVLAK